MDKEGLLGCIGTVLAIITAIGGFLYWHFKTINGFKDEIHKIEKEIIELKNKDQNQQEVIDQLKNYLPTLLDIVKRNIFEKH